LSADVYVLHMHFISRSITKQNILYGLEGYEHGVRKEEKAISTTINIKILHYWKKWSNSDCLKVKNPSRGPGFTKPSSCYETATVKKEWELWV